MESNLSMFQLLADPTRLALVEALRGGELAVGELVGRVPIAQSGVSRHLRLLHDAGVVEVRADGQRRLYQLRPEPFVALDGWLDRYRSLWEARLDRFGAALDRRRSTPREG